MIDTKELRRLAQAAIAKMNASDPEFASSTPPLAILELLDRLEAAESECLEQARLNGMGSEREAALMAKLEAAEKSDAESLTMYRKARDERDALRVELNEIRYGVAVAHDTIKALNARIEAAENDAAHQKALAASALRVAEGWERKCGELRAKIEAMEKQEPARLVTPTAYRWRYRGAVMWQYGELTEETARLAKEHNHEVQPLYALPGAHPAPSVPDGWLRAIDEAAESECLEQARLNGMGSEREAALMAKLEAAERERDDLRAKIKQMEKQEPVGEIRRANSTGNYINPVVWVPMAVGAKLYAGPGAKGEEK